MPAESDIRTHEEGLADLRSEALEDMRKAHAAMVSPLVDAITEVNVTGNDAEDMRALRDSLPGLFEKMDDGKIVDALEGLLTQTAAVSHTVAVPESIEMSDFAAEATTLEEGLEANG